MLISPAKVVFPELSILSLTSPLDLAPLTIAKSPELKPALST